MCSMGDLSGEYTGHGILFSFQELCTDPCDTGQCITMLKHEVMAADEGHDNGPQDLVNGLCAFKLPSIQCNCVRCP